LEFLTGEINKVVQLVGSVDELYDLLESKKMIGVYLGKQNKAW